MRSLAVVLALYALLALVASLAFVFAVVAAALSLWGAL